MCSDLKDRFDSSRLVIQLFTILTDLSACSLNRHVQDYRVVTEDACDRLSHASSSDSFLQSVS